MDNRSAFGLGGISPRESWKRLQHVLRARAECSDRHMIFYSLGNTSTPKLVSYRCLYAQARQNSLVVKSLPGFREEAPIIIHLEDHLDTIIWLWSVLLADALPVISSPLSNVDEHRHKHVQGLSTLLESPICITRKALVHLFDTNHTMKIHTVEFLENGCHNQQNGQHLQGDSADHKADLALLMLTSGSTGNAKAVRLTHHQILAAVKGKATVRRLPQDGSFLNWIGLDHVASLVEIHIQALWFGTDQIHAHAADIVGSPTKFLDLLSHHRVCRSFAPNFFLAKLTSVTEEDTSLLDNASRDLSNLTVLASGGEANSTQVCVAASKLFERFGARRHVITPGFGMTETCAGAIFNLKCPDYDVTQKRVTATLGKCMEGIELRVTIPGDGGTAHIGSVDEPGDLEVRGPVVFDGYYNNAEATAEAITTDGWFRTGDSAKIDQNGNLCLISRIKDVVNINGVKYVTADIQASVEQAVGSRVSRLVCFASRSAQSEMITVAYLPKSIPMGVEELCDVDDLIRQACVVAAGARPLVFSLRQASEALLPVSALGKISRPKMRSLFEADMFADDVQIHEQLVGDFRETRKAMHFSPPKNETEALLISDFAAVLGIEPKEISATLTLFELGYSSMDIIRLKHRIDTRLKMLLPVITLMKHPTARSLALVTGTNRNGSQDAKENVPAEYDPVVVLRSSGSKTPLFLIHPGVGEVLVFVGLAQYLADDDRPIFALRARGFEPSHDRFSCIAETVDTYVAAIRRVQPHGPYALAGYSYGTMLAFEISKKLTASNGPGTVQFLGSFNLPPHIKHRMRQLSWNSCLLHLAQFLDLVSEDRVEEIEKTTFYSIPKPEALAQVIEIADQTRLYELGLETQALTRWADVAFGLQNMAVDYEPSGTVDSIDVFHAIPLKMAASSREEWVEQHLYKWAEFCRSPPRFHPVGGAHYTMIGPEHAPAFAATLREALLDRGL